MELASQGPHQRGLADPGLAGHQHQTPLPPGRVVDRGTQHAELLVTLEQPHHDRDRNAPR
jgi:hypothetical protein